MNLVENSVWNFDVNGKPALNALGELENKLGELKTAQKELTRGTKEWTDNKAEIKELEESIKKTRVEMGTAGMTVKQLEGYYKQLNKELKDLTPGTDQYIEKTKELQDVNTRLSNVRKDVRAVTEEADKSKSTWTNMKEWITGALSAFTLVNIMESLINFTREGIKMAATMSDAFGGIQKAAGMTEQEVKNLNTEIAKIDTRTAQDELLGIAQVGGQIGVAKDQMLGFVESVDKAVVALGDEFSGGAEEVASTMGTLSKLFKETKDLEAGKAINDIGSAINELGAAGTATGPVVADFAMRMGQLGDLSPQISETLGLGAAFQELGLSAEISAGGLSNILLTASKDTATFATQVGLTEKEFIKLINSSPNEVILKLAESFRGMPTDKVVKNLDDLGIKSQEATKVMSLLSDQTDTVREKQLLAATAMKEGTSLTKEFGIMNNTAAAQLAKQEKALDELKTTLGAALLPALLNVTTGVIAFIKGIGAVPEFLRENKEMIAALGVAMVSLNWNLVMATASSLAHAAAEKGRLIWTESATAAQWLMNAAMTANPIGLVVAAVALFVGGLVTLYNNSETARNAINRLWQGIKDAASAVGSFFGLLSSENEKSLAKQKSDNDKYLSDKKGQEGKTAAEIAAANKATKEKELA
ncbi:TP901 family phage tail tape measure protein, partial [Dyadobacter jejuensis]